MSWRIETFWTGSNLVTDDDTNLGIPRVDDVRWLDSATGLFALARATAEESLTVGGSIFHVLATRRDSSPYSDDIAITIAREALAKLAKEKA